MPAYVSLLRAVNVTGHNKILMKDLAAMYESLGFENVRTYIQSGNVVFDTADMETSKLEDRIEDKIADQFGLQTTVMVRTPGEMQSVIERNPFLESDTGWVAVGFLSGPPGSPDLGRINGVKDEAEKIELSGAEAYLFYPNGQGRTKMTTAVIERSLGVACTVRNWRTVNKLLEMAQE